MPLENSCIAILALGNLGEAGVISANSLGNTGISKICVVADSAGKAWLSKSTLIDEKSALCFHNNTKIESVINRLSKDDNYVNFQSERFIRLMILKWILILDVFETHHNITSLLYSDLDVFWKKSPLQEIKTLDKSDKIFFIQDDSTLDGKREFFCPGIMIWKNSRESKIALNSIINFQDERNKNDDLLADDKALNLWLNFEGRVRMLERLPSKKYVIGHRFLWMIIGRKGFNLKKTICFHANYIKGKERKYIILKGASINYFSPLRLYFAIIYIMYRTFKL